MEFFRVLNIQTQEQFIQNTFTLDQLELLTNDIFVIGNITPSEAQIGGIWGEFTLTRSYIRGGLRFALKECPNALAWTITAGLNPEPETVVIHLTINRQAQTPEFIVEINDFLDDQCTCLKEFFLENNIPNSK